VETSQYFHLKGRELASLLPLVRLFCNNTKLTHTVHLNITLNTNLPQQNKEAVRSPWKVLQYCLWLDKIPAILDRYLKLLAKYFKILFIYYMSHGTPHDVLFPQNLGWETLHETLTSSYGQN